VSPYATVLRIGSKSWDIRKNIKALAINEGRQSVTAIPEAMVDLARAGFFLAVPVIDQEEP
jgi:hypothetical protein